MPPEDFEFLVGCCLGDGCLSTSRKDWNSTSLHLSHKASHLTYLEYKVSKVSRVLNSKAKIRAKLDKGKYPAYEYVAGNGKILFPIYQQLYPNNEKSFTKELLSQLGLQAVALFWMDDGSLHIRKRRYKDGYKIGDRQGCLAVYKYEEESRLVGDWIASLTDATPKLVRHVSGRFYLRWTGFELRKLVHKLEPFISPIECMRYKIDLQYTRPNTDVTGASPNASLLNNW